MKHLLSLCVLFLVTTSTYADEVKIAFVHINDVYEIAPISGGKHGGLARVQTLVNEVKQETKYTYTVLAGDFINPSAIGTAKVNGKRLNGRQIVGVLNAMRWDYITLGNHEFDLGREVLISRLNEAKFKTIINNVKDQETQQPFINTQPHEILEVEGVKIGITGVTLPVNKPFLAISDPLQAAEEAINGLKKENIDILVFISHLDFIDDEILAKKFPEIDLIMGGHEHENIYARRGSNLTPIAKADANARSAYVHTLSYDTQQKSLNITSQLHPIDQSTPEDPKVKKAVSYWLDMAYQAFREDGFNPDNIIAISSDALDGLEANVRNQSTSLTQLIGASALHAFEDAELSLVNSGSIRIDDIIPSGPISEYDVIRILPFGGDYALYSIPGDILERALNVGLENKGTGGYLIQANAQYTEGSWLIEGKKLDVNRSYQTASSTFLMTKGDRNLGFLVKNKRIKRISNKSINVQKALISELKKIYPMNTIKTK